MSQLTNIDTLMRQAPPGLMAYSRVQAEGQWLTALVIREDRQRIRALGRNPIIETRAGMFREAGVALLAIVIRVGGLRGDVYETWLNYHQTGGGSVYFDDLARQDQLPILFYGDRGRERQIAIRNPFKEIAAQAAEIISPLSPWSMSQFDQARERIYARYPDVQALWGALL